MAPTQRTDKGEATFVSPYTGEQFTSQFAYNDHLNRWPSIAGENGLALDGTPLAPEPPDPPPSDPPPPPESTGDQSTEEPNAPEEAPVAEQLPEPEPLAPEPAVETSKPKKR